MNKSPMTLRGAEKLKEELNELKKVVRPKIIKDIATAREHGDLKENAEYHAAREQQSFTEGRIADIEGKMSNAVIIDPKEVNADGKIVFGASVKLLHFEDETEIVYQIVGEDEADIKAGRISVQSPIARAMIGKEEEDVIEVNAPGGQIEYEILEISYE
ncbi:MAG: transcription elongation factor GreA [Gammaproteobacteria bacterium]